ncbi:nuclear transcription factor Y subunit alpha-like [Oryza brachyantha]|uniref:nuclear transcription factor Y subunit alpha-like n=1 Tax=Oryza brachyantha TaxID=4533 RepID=UPI00077645AF|nr:nuclear transcription factor Y subunit alpha-like [Oryza brachyantha]
MELNDSLVDLLLCPDDGPNSTTLGSVGYNYSSFLIVIVLIFMISNNGNSRVRGPGDSNNNDNNSSNDNGDRGDANNNSVPSSGRGSSLLMGNGSLAAFDGVEGYSSLDTDHWKEAVRTKIDSIISNGTWEVVEHPYGCKLAGYNWVFKKKLMPDGTIENYKARLVAKGYAQKEGTALIGLYSDPDCTVLSDSLLGLLFFPDDGPGSTALGGDDYNSCSIIIVLVFMMSNNGDSSARGPADGNNDNNNNKSDDNGDRGDGNNNNVPSSQRTDTFSV